MRVGLTGGVGSGKSTVAAMLSEHGALVIDADAIAREVVEPGTTGLAAVVERFGAEVLNADGGLDRPALASIVFDDAAARADLNGIIHPLVAERSRRLMAAASPETVVVYDIPLLAEGARHEEFDLVVVVEADVATRLARLAERGLAEQDARARMASQATDEQRRAIADEVISNDGGVDGLRAEIAALWDRICARQRSG